MRVLIMKCETPATTAEYVLLRHSLATEFAVRMDAVNYTFLNIFLVAPFCVCVTAYHPEQRLPCLENSARTNREK